MSVFNIKDLCRRKKWGCAPRCPVGTQRIYSGYIHERIDRSKYPSYRGSNFARKHVWLWELKNGPVPKGHMLKCLDGNKLNTDPDNWVLVQIGIISRLSRRNYDDAPAELKQTIMAVAELEHQLHRTRGGS
ncbi:HNH endonuclease signature motif containing protein [Nitrobacter vulgaris]|nr:HNH endonuclease signature motif containing protein [Nitrobacter vulgaris]